MKLVLLFRLIRESINFSINALIANKLRTLLSLLGITIGIFAIITVFTVVDSMESSIRKNIASLGDNVLFVQKWPWVFNGNFAWWKYLNRPQPTIEETNELKRRSSMVDASVFLVNVSKTVEYDANSVDNASINGVSSDYEKVKTFELTDGRFITETEFAAGREVAVIGVNTASDLFDTQNPIGKYIKVFGRKLCVIGIFKKEGSSSFGQSLDETIIVPINFLRNFVDLRSGHSNPAIMVKAKPKVSNDELRDDLTGIMRSLRKLKPIADDNFSINETSLLTKNFDGLFIILSLAGWIIGGFSILVGGFGIANIMFVSVKERTSMIGIQKSLGAKNYFILLQFIFESVILSLIGGALGLLLIFIGTTIISHTQDIELPLTLGNIIRGLTISAIVGLLSGVIPAYSASRLNPVEAMRTGQ